MQILPSTALFVLNLKSTSTSLLSPINGRRRRGRRRRSIIGSIKIPTSSLARALSFAISSLPDLFISDQFNLLHHFPAGGGGGGLGFPSGGGSNGEWFGKRRGKFEGLIGLLLFSTALVSVILGVGERKREELEFGIRVLVPMVLGFKIRVWSNRIGILMILTCASYALLHGRRRRERRRPW